MYGPNLPFKTDGSDGCDCEEMLSLIAEGKLDTEPLITHTHPLTKINMKYTSEDSRMSNTRRSYDGAGNGGVRYSGCSRLSARRLP